jgi:5-methyltetrahydropteroyltriglutamate--homocysteine methyltransferase
VPLGFARTRIIRIARQEKKMTESRSRPPFRADHVGSLIRPQALIEARDSYEAGRIPRDELRSIENAAISDAVKMQESVGLQSITDGELRRLNWRDGFFESVDGFSKDRVTSSFIFTDYSGEKRHGMPIPVVLGKLSRRKSITADDFAHLATLTRRTAKATLPSPTVNHFFAGDNCFAGSPYRSREAYFADIAAIYREEIADLARLGCRYVQIDEVSTAILCDPKSQEIVRGRSEDPDRLVDDYITLINDCVRDRPSDMTVAIHMCRGNQGHGIASGGYAPVAERLFNRLNVDGFFLEFDTERAGGFEPLRHLPKGKVAALGLISTKLPELEIADLLKRRIEAATKFAGLDQLCLCPQCGFASSYKTTRFSFDDQERKLSHLVKVANEIWS